MTYLPVGKMVQNISSPQEEESLHFSIESCHSEDYITSLLKQNPQLACTQDENKVNPLQLLHHKYFQSVFYGAFHNRNTISTFLHDEWFESGDWAYVSTVATILVMYATIADDFRDDERERDCIDANFLVIHAALRIKDCPIDVIRFLVMSPWKKSGLDCKDSEGNLALHLSIDLLEDKIYSNASKEEFQQCKCLITDILEIHPESARVSNDAGQFPITKLLELIILSSRRTESNTCNVDDMAYDWKCILDPLTEQFSPTEALTQTIYNPGFKSTTKTHLALFSSLAGTMDQIDISFQLLQEVPWILGQVDVR